LRTDNKICFWLSYYVRQFVRVRDNIFSFFLLSSILKEVNRKFNLLYNLIGYPTFRSRRVIGRTAMTFKCYSFNFFNSKPKPKQTTDLMYYSKRHFLSGIIIFTRISPYKNSPNPYEPYDRRIKNKYSHEIKTICKEKKCSKRQNVQQMIDRRSLKSNT
jgi:hypothetical protein